MAPRLESQDCARSGIYQSEIKKKQANRTAVLSQLQILESQCRTLGTQLASRPAGNCELPPLECIDLISMETWRTRTRTKTKTRTETETETQIVLHV